VTTGRDSVRLLCGAALLLLCSAVSADDRAERIKAAFVYNFAKFVEWPASAFQTPQQPIRLCALRAEAGDNRLDLIEGRSAQGREISLQLLESPRQSVDCHILYLANSRDNYDGVLALLIGKPVLTISEDVGFIDRDGMVSLFIDDNHVRFRINLKAAQATGLKVSARILQLAQEVR